MIPFRNAADTLPECLDSLQQQTLRGFEAVLVNDGSEDRSVEIVHARAETDARLRLISPGRIGLVAALNLGIAQSRAELIARMDADDIMDRDRLLQQVQFLDAHPEVVLAGCQVRVFPDDAVRDGYQEYVRWQNACVDAEQIASNMYVESTLAHPSVMLRRAAIEAVGGYRQGNFPEDYDLWLRLHEAGLQMAKVPRVLLAWRDSAARTSRIDERYSREAFDRLRAEYLSRDPRVRSGRALVVWGGGRPTRQRVRQLTQSGVKIHAWVDVHPRRIGRTIGGLPVHPWTWLDRTPKPFVLVYVANHGARDRIAGALEQLGYCRGRDYLAVG